MSESDDDPTPEDDLYAFMFGSLSAIFHQNWLLPALAIPLVLVLPIVRGTGGLALVGLIWLGMGTAYWAIEYRHHGVSTPWALVLVVIGTGVLLGSVLILLGTLT